MMRWMVVVLAVAACSTGAPRTPDQIACEHQAEDDPAVRLLIIKGAGSENFQLQSQDRLAAARQDATVACLQRRGIVRRGGVERQKALDN